MKHKKLLLAHKNVFYESNSKLLVLQMHKLSLNITIPATRTSCPNSAKANSDSLVPLS